jgi:hypothetical protein
MKTDERSQATRHAVTFDESAWRGKVPTEFRFWEHRDEPVYQAARRIIAGAFGSPGALDDEAVRAWGESYYKADPVAERFVAEVYLTRGQAAGRALVDRALEHGIDAVPDAPASLRALFAEIENTPDWVDMQRVDEGARVFRRFGRDLFSFAGAITLHGYRESSIAKPLAFTGAYAGATAQNRFLETASYWIDVSSPGGLSPRGAGVRTSLRVRLMHVFVRAGLLAHPKWDLEAWGVPISQGDALLTLMGGSFVPGYGLRLLGYLTTRDEIEALLHFWRYAGHLMGVQPPWYPANVGEAAALMWANEVKSCGRAGEDGRDLVRSYVEAFEPSDASLVARLEHGREKAFVSWFVPPWTRAEFGVPSAGLWNLYHLARAPKIVSRELRRRASPRFAAREDERVQAESLAWLAARLGTRHVEYKAVEKFTR